MKKIVGILIAILMLILLSATAYASSFLSIIDNADLLSNDEETYFETRIIEIKEVYDCHITLVSEELDTLSETYDYAINFESYDPQQNGIVFMVFEIGAGLDYEVFGYGDYLNVGMETIDSLIANLDYVEEESAWGEENYDLYDGAVDIFQSYLERYHEEEDEDESVLYTFPPEDYVGIGKMINGFDPMLDAAEVLTETEEQQLFEKIEYINKNYNFDVTLMTMNKVPGDKFLHDYLDWYTGLDPTRDGAVFGIDLNPDNRDYVTSTRNLGEYAFTEDALDLIDYDVAPLLTEGRYFEAYDLFLDHTIMFVDSYQKAVPYDAPLDISVVVVFMIALPLAIAFFIAKLIMKYVFIRQMKTAVIKIDAERFVVKDSLTVTNSTDVFTHKSTIRTKIETASSKRSGSKRSGYGGSRGGRSGKF